MIVQSPFYMNVDKIPENINFVSFLLEKFYEFKNDIALVDSISGWKCTFEELPFHVAKYQKLLENSGVSLNDHVALISLNHPEFIFAQLAIASLGAVSVCINPLSTPYELAYCLNTSDAKYVVVHRNFEDKVRSVQSQTSSVKKIEVMPDQNIKEILPEVLKIKGTSRCFDMHFSSGTTGRPKAAMSYHRAMVAHVIVCSQSPWAIPIKADRERCLLAIPLHHAYAGQMVYHGMYNRYVTVTVPRFYEKQFLQVLQDYKITNTHLVQPLIKFLATSPMIDNYDLSHLKSVSCGSAPLSPQIARQCKARLKLDDLRQLYGMSEIRTVTWSPYGSDNFGSIGLLLPNVRLQIVDPDDGRRCTEAGQIGEFWFTGVNVTEGAYYKNPEANGNFYVREGDVVWTKTGDCGYFDKFGQVYIMDRYKDIIKYKGFQVSPTELESLLRINPGVLDCVVAGKPDDEAGELPTAFVVPKDNVDKIRLKEELASLINEKLSSYKHLKGGIHFVKDIPRSAAGKMSRAKYVTDTLKLNSKL